MTENENLEKQIADDLSAVLKEAKSMGCKEVACFRHIPLQNVETVIKALEEIQQYRVIGTVEEIQRKIDALKYDCTRYEEQLSIARGEKQVFTDDDMLLEECRTIGTIEEFKALKEKSVAKKVIRWADGSEHCPCCDFDNSAIGYGVCIDCGQKLDCSE